MSVITITRGTKAGGLRLAECLSVNLGYRSIGREEIIAEGAKKFNLLEEILNTKLDKTPSMWQKFTNEYQRYICLLQCALLQFIIQDNIIYHGHAGQFFLSGLPSILKIRIEAPVEYRIKAVMSETQYSRNQAIEYINKVDSQRKRWVKMVYNQEWSDPALYDICFNLQSMTIDHICEIIARIIEKKEFATTEKSKRKLENFALECNVKAKLALDDKIFTGHKISILADNGKITLRGTAKNEDIRDLIIRNTLEVEGVIDCNSELRVLSDEIH